MRNHTIITYSYPKMDLKKVAIISESCNLELAHDESLIIIKSKKHIS